VTRLLDRYILSIFVPAIGMFAVGLVFLALAVDFASKLGRFLALKNVETLAFIGWYYLVRLPMILTFILPAVMLFAPMFTMIKLARTNEILPIAASGTSLRRISASFIVAALLATLIMASMDEYVLPKVDEEIADSENILTSRAVNYSVEDWDGYTMLWGAVYEPAKREMSHKVIVTRIDKDAQTIERVEAKTCRWDPARKRWVAFDGVVEKPQEELRDPDTGKPHTRKDPIPPEGYVVQADFKLDSLRKSKSFIGQFSFLQFRQLRQLAKKYPHVPSYRMRIHNRFSFPLSPLVLLLMGLPFVVDARSTSFIKGLFVAFLLALGYYLTHFGCLDLGNRGSLPSAWAAWGPTGAFGLIGLVAFARMKT
jgi:lipopolysaccharide export LptBFGC system permease protein LptF